MSSPALVIATAFAAATTAAMPSFAAQPAQPASLGNGFAGVWYSVGSSASHGPKYGGGLATYPQQHSPIALYSDNADKTFFVYGGRNTGGGLQHMVSYFDHATGKVARPRMWLDLGSNRDAHFNPTLAIDGDGRLVMFSNVHGNSGQARIRRSVDAVTSAGVLDSFQGLLSTAEPNDLSQGGQTVYGSAAGVPRFSYSNAWHVPGQGFLHMHTRYVNATGTADGGNRDLFFTTSADADNWSARQNLTSIQSGSYQISWRHGQTVGTAFDMHPSAGINGNPAGSDSRTNLYYLQTSDLGQTWTTAGGAAVTLPVVTASNAALVRNYQAENKLVYMKDLNYDAAGNPIILYLTSPQSAPGPAERTLHTAHFSGGQWVIRDVGTTDHNYDHGSFYVEPDGTWRIIAPFLDGPQHYGTGGEVGVWTSSDEGLNWTLLDELTGDSTYNHTYVRRPFDAQEDFYALWADGDAFGSSPSQLYFSTREGNVYRLPTDVTAFDANNLADPILVRAVPEPGVALAGIGAALIAVSRRRRP